jgi:adenylate cyclase
VHGRGFGSLLRWEMRFRDVLVNQGRRNPPDPRLVFLGIDEASVSIEEVDLESLFADVPRDSADFRALTLMSRQWPWPREIYALLLDKLFAAGARVVVFDLMFPKPSADDEAFRAALERYRDRVVIGSNFVQQTAEADRVGWVHALPTDSLVPQTQPLDARVAFVNFWPDATDEVIRRARFRLTVESLAGYRPNPDSEIFVSLAARAVTQAGLGGLVPAGADEERPFRFTAPPGAGFRALPVYQLFVPKYRAANFGGGAFFRDKIVVIGPYGNWQHDEHETPFGRMPGPELHLNAINALLHQAFLSETPLWADALLILAGGVVAWLVAQLSPKPALQILRGVGVTTLGALLALGAYNFLDLYTAVVTPLLALNLSGGACFVYEFIIERLDKLRTRRALERYVSKDIVRELLDNRQSVLNALGGARKPITVLFSDLRGFTTLTETADAVGLVTQLNEYFNRMVRIVFANAGTLDKFIGDGLMAHWGSIVSEGPQADACAAVRTALQMRAALAQLNAEWRERGIQTLDFGIGINSGEAIVGNLGCEEKMEVSVIGDPVNLAARIEGATKQYRVDLLVGEETARLVVDAFVLRSVDQLRVKGKTRPVEVLTVLAENDEETMPSDWLVLYEVGVRLYRRRAFARAAELFEAATHARPGDGLIEEYLRRAQIYAVQPPGPEWSGVHVLSEK